MVRLTAQELKERLTEDDIRNLLINELGATIHYEDDAMWITDTVCHHGTKPKLYFYKDSQSFHCYTECGHMDIISVVMEHKGYTEEEFTKAINWICIKANIDNYSYGFGTHEKVSDWEFIRKIKSQSKRRVVDMHMEEYDPSILNTFQKKYHMDWINDGISIRSMVKYGVLYSTWQQRIIIPHYDLNGRLVGIRGRSLIEEEIELFGKYTPYKVGNKFYNHELGKNLYGLDKNKEAIQRKQKIMLVEAEKSVMQADTMFGEDNFTVALCGSNLTECQKQIILRLGVKEVLIALDKQYENLDDEECKKWAEHIKKKFVVPLAPYVKVSILWDVKGLLGYKDSPTDRGKDTLLQLMNDKIFIGTSE